jgi:hypothetical protein
VVQVGPAQHAGAGWQAAAAEAGRSSALSSAAPGPSRGTRLNELPTSRSPSQPPAPSPSRHCRLPSRLPLTRSPPRAPCHSLPAPWSGPAGRGGTGTAKQKKGGPSGQGGGWSCGGRAAAGAPRQPAAQPACSPAALVARLCNSPQKTQVNVHAATLPSHAPAFARAPAPAPTHLSVHIHPRGVEAEGGAGGVKGDSQRPPRVERLPQGVVVAARDACVGGKAGGACAGVGGAVPVLRLRRTAAGWVGGWKGGMLCWVCGVQG